MSLIFAAGCAAGGTVVASGFVVSNAIESKGAFWESVLYFTEDAQRYLDNDQVKVPCNYLLDYFVNVDGVTEAILEVSIYSERLHGMSFKTEWISHSFVIIKSETYFWSLEKMSVGIFVQRSEKLEPLIERLRSQTREGVELKKNQEVSGKMHMLKVFNWMKNNPGVFKCYHYITSNCQDFSQLLFKEICDGKNSIAG